MFNERADYMNMGIDLSAIYVVSDNVSTRQVNEELLIVPLVSSIGDKGEELFILNATGKAIWARLDGKSKLKDIVEELSSEFDAPVDEISGQVIEFAKELLKRHIILQVS